MHPYFAHLLRLLEMEMQEDLRQYRQQVKETPLHERKKKGLTWYPVTITASEIGAGEQLSVSLERTKQLDEPSRFQVGDSVALFQNLPNENTKNSLNGVITALWRNNMRISFATDDLPDWVDEGNLGIDWLFDTASYKEMELALKRAAEAGNTLSGRLREILLGEKQAEFEQELPAYLEVKSLNPSQNKAIKQVLAAHSLAIIHGPPGTGKTTTLTEAIKLTLQQEKQVLVTAPSNAAVDLLTEKLLQKGLRVLRIGNPARIDENLINHTLDGQVVQHPEGKNLRKLRRDADEFRRMAHKYKRNFGKDEREQRKLLFAEAHKMLDDAKRIEQYIAESVLNKAQVITATLVGAANQAIRNRRFRTVFIDEAVQALEPACWIPILKAERVIFAGDHCQLPPTVKSYEAAKAGLAETLFEKVIRQQKADVMLQTQYRMNEKIMNFSNRQFYKGELEAHKSVKTHTLKEKDEMLSQAVEFIDLAGCGFEEKTNAEASKYNPEEADLLIRHLIQLLQYIQNISPEVFTEVFSIGVISPYSAQVNYLTETIRQHPDLQEYQSFIQINSIDGFQGQEKDVIYISLVRSNEKGEIGFLSDTRRMNVALTRARKKLVVLGDSATLASHPFYQSFLNYIEEIQAYKSAWDF